MVLNVMLLFVLIICVITDVKSRKIYNKVLFPSLLFAITFHVITNGLDGLLFSITGLLVGLGILLIPYLMGGMGAGDVKLLAVIGAFKGVSFVVTTAIYMALFGGIIALGIILFHKGPIQRLKSIFFTVVGIRHGIKIPLAVTKESLKKTYPYGVSIAGGACVAFLSKGWVI
ncbi:prepilin peptidase CpaA [Salirhabdus euzebyi]|uniref:Prepilin peptidase CpaA n=1 Tax=Salirhabdus euzebyi TaxID=394506 RepID=A0A841Q9Y8_9BACI|nr:prepilin peptidase [Salirhabdus euzebyi]MBB6455113.1 prepilin peptidase CpaA [Salirhabdus euzebyi]